MTAPERIFAWPSRDTAVSWAMGCASNKNVGPSRSVEYIRADLHEAEIARLTAERDAALEPQPITVQDAARALLTKHGAALNRLVEIVDDVYAGGASMGFAVGSALRAIAEQEGR